MYTAGSCKYSFEVVWCGFPDTQVRCLCLAGRLLLLDPDHGANIHALQTPSLLRLLVFDRSSCLLEFPPRMNVKEGEYPAKATPFVTLGRFQEGKSGEDPASSTTGLCRAEMGRGEVHGCIFCCSVSKLDATHRFQQVRIRAQNCNRV